MGEGKEMGKEYQPLGLFCEFQIVLSPLYIYHEGFRHQPNAGIVE
jgi:hypothetical protein